jgi:hypothetical protein
MKNNKHIQKFNEHQENLNMSDVIHSDSFRKELNDAYLFYKENVLDDDELLSAQQFLDIYTIGYKKALENHWV